MTRTTTLVDEANRYRALGRTVRNLILFLLCLLFGCAMLAWAVAGGPWWSYFSLGFIWLASFYLLEKVRWNS